MKKWFCSAHIAILEIPVRFFSNRKFLLQSPRLLLLDQQKDDDVTGLRGGLDDIVDGLTNGHSVDFMPSRRNRMKVSALTERDCTRRVFVVEYYVLWPVEPPNLCHYFINFRKNAKITTGPFNRPTSFPQKRENVCVSGRQIAFCKT